MLIKIGIQQLRLGQMILPIYLLLKNIKTKLPIILSRGMSDISEVVSRIKSPDWFENYPGFTFVHFTISNTARGCKYFKVIDFAKFF